MVQLALCDGDRDNCASPAALKLLAIVDQARTRDGRALLGETNRAINLAIRADDGARETSGARRSRPSQRGAGDCEDYAIAKLAALRLAGVAAEDLRIVVVRDTRSGEGHAVASARLDGHWLMLDNRRMAMVEDDDARNYQPLFVLYQSAVLKYVGEPCGARASGSRWCRPRRSDPSSLEPGWSVSESGSHADLPDYATLHPGYRPHTDAPQTHFAARSGR